MPLELWRLYIVQLNVQRMGEVQWIRCTPIIGTMSPVPLVGLINLMKCVFQTGKVKGQKCIDGQLTISV